MTTTERIVEFLVSMVKTIGMIAVAGIANLLIFVYICFKMFMYTFRFFRSDYVKPTEDEVQYNKELAEAVIFIIPWFIDLDREEQKVIISRVRFDKRKNQK